VDRWAIINVAEWRERGCGGKDGAGGAVDGRRREEEEVVTDREHVRFLEDRTERHQRA
jgi:hypothetical protein